MADSNIGALPQVQDLYDDSLLVVEQQGQAMKATGAQFKEFGRQAVVGQVQDYVDAAQAAANQATGAVSAVTDMTVEARTLDDGQPATVSKTTKNGKVNLSFGLPRGAQGAPGPAGQIGPRGPKGDPGTGLKILGYCITLAELETAWPSPEAGDAFGVGEEAPYNIYVFDGVTGAWKDNGPLSGGGSVLPENVVTSEGGAEIVMPESLGDAPHVITITDEEIQPLTAKDIVYGDSSVGEAMDQLFTSVGDGKARIASAVTGKGVPTAQDATFEQMAENIGKITTSTGTEDATATPGDILAPKTAYTAAGKVEGVIPTLAAQTITPGTADQTIANGQYLGGTQTIKGDPNLTSGNIKKGVTIFGVPGAVEQTFLATLTVTADIGAVVTAKNGDTEVSALSTTGTVTLELPIEGTWTVTAVRGVAQYNSVTVNVTSNYTAALTAEVHIEYLGTITGLGRSRSNPATAVVGDYALFAGGRDYGSTIGVFAEVDAYNTQLARTTPTELSSARQCYGAANSKYAIFSGTAVNAYDASLTRITPQESRAEGFAAASIGDCVLIPGSDSSYAYDSELTRISITPLISPRSVAASSNSNYALFGGGGSTIVDAYNTSLTRSTPTQLSVARSELSAACAGNYVIFAGGYPTETAVDAYDLFLTRTTPEELSAGRCYMAAASLHGYALFAGGGWTEYSAYNYYYQRNEVEAYDQFLTSYKCPSIAVKTGSMGGVSIGNYALFGGGGRQSTSGLPNASTVYAYRYV